MKGGLKQINKELSSWQAVWYMINVPGSTIEIVSYTSLKGFIFRLDVPKDEDVRNIVNTQFEGLNEDRTSINKPVYSLVFKISIIDMIENQLPYINIDRKSIDKYTEIISNFIKEAYVQQDIYSKTLSPGGYPITISVVDFSYFNDVTSVGLLNTFLSKLSPNNLELTRYILRYLINVINSKRPRYKLGIITMELIQTKNFETLHDISKRNLSGQLDRNIFTTDIEYAIAQNIILWVKLHIINYDSHSRNVLVSNSPILPQSKLDGTTDIRKTIVNDLDRSILIDFGRIIKVRDLTSFGREFISLYNKYQRKDRFDGFDYYNRDLTNLLRIDITQLYPDGSSDNPVPDEKINILEDVVKFIGFADFITNSIKFGSDTPQCISFLKYLYPKITTYWNVSKIDWEADVSTDEKYKRISYIIEKLTVGRIQQTNKTSGTAIERLIHKGEIFSIPYDSFRYLYDEERNGYYKDLYYKDDPTSWEPSNTKEVVRIKGLHDELDKIVSKYNTASATNDISIPMSRFPKDRRVKTEAEEKKESEEEERAQKYIARLQAKIEKDKKIREERYAKMLESKKAKEDKEWYHQSYYNNGDDSFGGRKTRSKKNKRRRTIRKK